MAYIIAEPCIGTKDTACVDVCPVDCIQPCLLRRKFTRALPLKLQVKEILQRR
jgi:NAD-dependent dihydropyrimidine dehydrogenase PreA subunit